MAKKSKKFAVQTNCAEVIEDCILAIRIIWDLENEFSDWGFFLIDTVNIFNNGAREIMIWNIRHEWQSGYRFVFNIHKH